MYHTAALGVVYDKDTHEQHFFLGHDDDITALDMHPDKIKMVTGQIGKDPKILVWSSKPDSSGALQQLCQIQGDHKRAIVGLSFSATGQYIATMGKDNFRSIALYKWGTGGKKLQDMRVGMDKGHNDEVFQAREALQPCLTYPERPGPTSPLFTRLIPPLHCPPFSTPVPIP